MVTTLRCVQLTLCCTGCVGRMGACKGTYAMHFCSSAELVRVLDVPGKAVVTASDMRVREAARYAFWKGAAVPTSSACCSAATAGMTPLTCSQRVVCDGTSSCDRLMCAFEPSCLPRPLISCYHTVSQSPLLGLSA